MPGKPNFSMVLPDEIRQMVTEYKGAEGQKSLSQALLTMVVERYVEWAVFDQNETPLYKEAAERWEQHIEANSITFVSAEESGKMFVEWWINDLLNKWGGKRK